MSNILGSLQLLTNPFNYSYLQTFVEQGYKGTTNEREDWDKLGLLSIKNISTNYWLAWHYVGQKARNAEFNVYYVDSNGYSSSSLLFYSYGDPKYRSSGFRPIFLLKSNVKISGGTGTSTDPYILEAGE